MEKGGCREAAALFRGEGQIEVLLREALARRGVKLKGKQDKSGGGG